MIKIQAHRVGQVLAAASLMAGLMHAAGAGEAVARSGDVLRAQAMTLVAQQQEAQALALFEERVRQQPGRPEALNDLGVVLVRLGRLAEARQRFDEALRTSEAHALAHDNLLQLQLNMARHAYAAALQQTGQPLPPAEAGLQWSAAPAATSASVPPTALA